jgi:uncharacterized protein (DUF1786 family)
MQILAVDIGTGTQDILLFDSDRTPENCLKMVMPSPTLRLSQAIQAATEAQLPLLITGVIMGGGPCTWAAEAHRRAGLPVLATADAARTFNDDLDLVQREMGVKIISADKATNLALDPGYRHVIFRDFDYTAIREAFSAFGINLKPGALALAVFDHGAAAPGVSDRQFRMDYLVSRLHEDRRLSTFAFKAEDVPSIMTRLRAVADTAVASVAAAGQTGTPVIVMDTAPAAVLGALDDPLVAKHPAPLVANVGNFHTLAFQFKDGQCLRVFEHHTGILDGPSLATWLRALADGSISHEIVFADHGHGALALEHTPVSLDLLAVTGPRQVLLRDQGLPVYFAVPHGDQMLTGCFGLLRACADIVPAWRDAISASLAGSHDTSLW